MNLVAMNAFDSTIVLIEAYSYFSRMKIVGVIIRAYVDPPKRETVAQ